MHVAHLDKYRVPDRSLATVSIWHASPSLRGLEKRVERTTQTLRYAASEELKKRAWNAPQPLRLLHNDYLPHFPVPWSRGECAGLYLTVTPGCRAPTSLHLCS